MVNVKFAENIAFVLDRPGHDLAFVIARDEVFFSYYETNLSSPSSSVTQLIQGIFDRLIDQSFFILRNRIFTTAQVSEMCRGMVRVAAKRVTGGIKAVNHHLDLRMNFIEIGAGNEKLVFSQRTPENKKSLAEIEKIIFQSKDRNFNDFVIATRRLAAEVPRGAVLHDYDRDIAALLVDKSGELLSYGLNSNSKNKTLHAEVNLVQRLFQDKGMKIPFGAMMFVTHKPCCMCSGMIYEWSEDTKSLKVYFEKEELGALSSKTILDSLGVNRKLSPAN